MGWTRSGAFVSLMRSSSHFAARRKSGVGRLCFAYHRLMMRFLRRTASAVVEFLRAEKPDAVVLALAVVAAGVAAAVCLPRGFERNGIQVPAAAAWGIMGFGILIAGLAALRPWPALLAWIDRKSTRLNSSHANI